MKNRISRTLASIVLSAIIVFLAAQIGIALYKPTAVISKIPYATLNIIGGSVRVQTKDTLNWKPAREGMAMEPGDRIRTLPDSRGFIVFYQGTTTTLEPGTDLIIGDLTHDADKQPDRILLEQRLGKTWTQVTERTDGDSYFRIKTSSAEIKVHGTLFITEVEKDGKTTVQTTKGEVSVKARGQEVYVPSGQQTIVERGSTPSAPTPVPPARNELVFTVDEDAEGLIVTPSGSKTGHLPGGQTVNQIPGSQISSTNGSLQNIWIPEPETGEYSVVLQGDNGHSTSYTVEGFTDGQKTFESSESGDGSSLNQTVLKLHVDVLDGLLTKIPGLNLMSEVTTENSGPVSSAVQGSNESVTPINESPGTAKTSSEFEIDDQFHLGEDYSTREWIIIISVVAVLGLGVIFIWRRI